MATAGLRNYNRDRYWFVLKRNCMLQKSIQFTRSKNVYFKLFILSFRQTETIKRVAWHSTVPSAGHQKCDGRMFETPAVSFCMFFILRLHLLGNGPEPFPEANRTGSASVYMEPFGTDPGVDKGSFWNRSGTDPKLNLQNSKSSFGSFWTPSGLVPERSPVNIRPTRTNFRTGSIWIRLEPVPCKHSLLG